MSTAEQNEFDQILFTIAHNDIKDTDIIKPQYNDGRKIFTVDTGNEKHLKCIIAEQLFQFLRDNVKQTANFNGALFRDLHIQIFDYFTELQIMLSVRISQMTQSEMKQSQNNQSIEIEVATNAIPGDALLHFEEKLVIPAVELGKAISSLWAIAGFYDAEYEIPSQEELSNRHH